MILLNFLWWCLVYSLTGASILFIFYEARMNKEADILTEMIIWNEKPDREEFKQRMGNSPFLYSLICMVFLPVSLPILIGKIVLRMSDSD